MALLPPIFDDDVLEFLRDCTDCRGTVGSAGGLLWTPDLNFGEKAIH